VKLKHGHLYMLIEKENVLVREISKVKGESKT